MKKAVKNGNSFDVDKVMIEDFDYDYQKEERRQKWNKKKK